MRTAFSLVELLATLSISLIALIATLPSLTQIERDVRFEHFASMLAGHLTQARLHAQTAETAVSVDFREVEDDLYTCFVEGPEAWDLFAAKSRGQGYHRQIRNQLPAQPLHHPTQGRLITDPLRSTHKPEVIFTPYGASGASVVFSDGGRRVLCAVISARTARFRIYIKTSREREWRMFY